MSESVIEVDATLEVSEVSEIKDSSVETESPSLLESANNKRRLDDDENDLEEFDNDDETRSTRKKMCIEDDTEIETEKDVNSHKLILLRHTHTIIIFRFPRKSLSRHHQSSKSHQRKLKKLLRHRKLRQLMRHKKFLEK